MLGYSNDSWTSCFFCYRYRHKYIPLAREEVKTPSILEVNNGGAETEMNGWWIDKTMHAEHHHHHQQQQKQYDKRDGCVMTERNPPRPWRWHACCMHAYTCATETNQPHCIRGLHTCRPYNCCCNFTSSTLTRPNFPHT